MSSRKKCVTSRLMLKLQIWLMSCKEGMKDEEKEVSFSQVCGPFSYASGSLITGWKNEVLSLSFGILSSLLAMFHPANIILVLETPDSVAVRLLGQFETDTIGSTSDDTLWNLLTEDTSAIEYGENYCCGTSVAWEVGSCLGVSGTRNANSGHTKEERSWITCHWN